MSAPRVCVLGAGAGGISTARLLVGKGYDVTVLEQTDRVGGMCRSLSYTDRHQAEARWFDVGANYVTKDYVEVRALADELGFDLVTDTAFQHQTALNLTTRTVQPGVKVVNEGISRLAFGWAAVRYLWLQWRHRALIRRPGFAGLADVPDLLRPFDAWLDAHDLTSLARLFTIPITAFGYGQLSEVPAAAALKYLDSGRFLSMLATGLHLPQSWPKRVRRGFGSLLAAAADGLQLELLAKVTSVTRSPGRVEVRWSRADGTKVVEEFGHLIVAMPPDEAVAFLDATEDERALFAPGVIRYRDFRVCTAVVPDFPYQVVLELEAEADQGSRYPGGVHNTGHPWIFGKQWADSELLLFYASVERGAPPRGVQDQAKADCAVACDLGGSGTWNGLHSYQEWPRYFPHVSVEDARSYRETGQGWYDLVEGLQGQAATYWVHGVVAFELVESILAYARSLVEKHFPAVPPR